MLSKAIISEIITENQERRRASSPRQYLQLFIIDFQEVRDFPLPAVRDEGRMVRVIVVAAIGVLVLELHGEAEFVMVLGADLPEAFEILDAGDRGKQHG